ncbi:MAG: hypothetical protein JWN51_3199, partial [Phycisphaerales bacterium]|nr:hypothetical protein [Phycisphaerales bacterium]
MMSATMRVHLFTLVCITFLTAPTFAEETPPAADTHRHWAFVPPVRPTPPVVKNAAWVRNPIDAFLAAEHERRELTPRPEADKATLLRRVYLNLIGIPPTRQELHAFLADESADSFEKVVDRLLASPAYGERWGRHWLDVWRYSDWAGFMAEVRDSQPFVWRWRDWAVESLNADKGYDRMVQEMLAGDELAPDDPQTIRATGYLARNWYKFNRNVWLENTVEHTSKAFLGMTVNCAKCHDHKYDPISQKEHYQFRAIFESYNVRTDRVPGQPDATKDGLVRSYDADAQAKTFLFIRGDEKQPDESSPLAPAVPAVFGGKLDVQPVNLPAAAYYPGLRPFEQQETLAAADAQIHKAQSEITNADDAVATARKALDAAIARTGDTRELTLAQAGAAGASLSDDFSHERSDLWKPGIGQWEYKSGHLAQLQTGAQERALASLPEIPQDFTARFKFTITGGVQWCSVGLTFDATDSFSNTVYLSAFSGGPKLQIAHGPPGALQYPSEGAKSLPIKLGQPYTLRVDAKGPLLNVYVDDVLAVVYQLPHVRNHGKFQIWAFDASAEFISLRVDPLPANAVITETPSAGAAQATTDPMAAAELALTKAEGNAALARLHIATARADRAFAESRTAADAARYASPPSSRTDELMLAAGKAEVEAKAAKAEELLEQAWNELLIARVGKDPAAATAAGKKHADACKAWADAQSAADHPSAAYSSLGTVYPASSTGRRLALARWITSRENPLAARVAINHIWTRHFGEPLVPTVFDFGLNGKPPTNPQLLDWLAVELMDGQWKMKAIHRLIVTSSAYRMQSTAGENDANSKIDPDNRALWRMNPRRLEAEAVRDGILSVSGQLDPTPGGPDLDESAGQSVFRKSLYFRTAAEKQMVFLKVFDAPNPAECYRRLPTIMPQQALALANSP